MENILDQYDENVNTGPVSCSADEGAAAKPGNWQLREPLAPTFLWVHTQQVTTQGKARTPNQTVNKPSAEAYA